ncbi:hypothetical protein [Thiothrix subterranea]|uniref:hypothetical protein n=1 Tax=Thiothrix subterranea TaxID=2735563 RepID=UPI00280C3563|nr:hypothetical protein [Thiothrix subterranea]
MVYNTTILSRLLLVIGCCLSAASSAAPDEPAVKLSNNWYKAAFDTRFPPAMPALPAANGWVVLYKNKADLMGEQYDDVFRPVSSALNAALSADSTVNPFRKRYPAFYTPANNRKRLDCPVLGFL